MRKVKQLIIKEYEKELDFNNNKIEIKKKIGIRPESKLDNERRVRFKRLRYVSTFLILLVVIGISFTHLGYKLNNNSDKVPGYKDVVSEKLSEFVIDTVPIPFYSQVILNDFIIYYYVGINDLNENVIVANILTIKDYVEVTFSYQGKDIEIKLDEFTADNSRWFALKFEETDILKLNIHVTNNIQIDLSKDIDLNVKEYLGYIRNS